MDVYKKDEKNRKLWQRYSLKFVLLIKTNNTTTFI